MKRLFLVAIALVLVLMVSGCTHAPPAAVNQNPAGQFTTLPYDSEIDPNIFYAFFPASEPVLYHTDTGEVAYLVHLYNPDPTCPVQYATVFITEDSALLVYGYELNGELFIYRLDRELNRYVRHTPGNSEDKSSGI